jgi:hypothetical protein
MVSYFKIQFDHPDYSPLDPMPMGMNIRYIPANSDIEAQRIFRSRYPKYKDGVRQIEDTGCSTLEEVTEWEPWGDNIPKFDKWDRDHGYVDFNVDIENEQQQSESKQSQNPKFKDVLSIASKYARNLFRRR